MDEPAHRAIVKKAKQEVFDDIESMDIDDLSELWSDKQYLDIKDKHLNTQKPTKES